MSSFTISGIQIFVLNENERFPKPHRDSSLMYAIREDEEHQHWLYTLHDQGWILVSETPFKNEGLAIEAAMAFDISVLYKK
ncbi:hypothetical protein [Serratia proteamaculans]|uniref:hypothetical protein n=1 Tax=Serratia proteamaculans TaxID=28151 RepID=UPI002179ECC6|nr:hypothetical protein [Serratia proteamaculans]CAI1754989.1 Uncharacterised protein [Serratia proteamaculans]